MSDTQIKFTDASGYDDYMGVCSQLAGRTFLDWLKPASGLRWLDVGCGSGAFTEMVVQRCAPQSIDGIDPAEEQLVFARARPALRAARFHVGDAMSLPFAENTFDAAVMPLVIFFVPKPLTGVAEMARVVAPGGIVTAYGWDITGGGFPYIAVQDELIKLGIPRRREPSPDAASMEKLNEVWTSASLEQIETREINVKRTFLNADSFWSVVRKSPNLGPTLAALPPDQFDVLKARVNARLADSTGQLTCHGRANAIRGRVPA